VKAKWLWPEGALHCTVVVVFLDNKTKMKKSGTL